MLEVLAKAGATCKSEEWRSSKGLGNMQGQSFATDEITGGLPQVLLWVVWLGLNNPVLSQTRLYKNSVFTTMN